MRDYDSLRFALQTDLGIDVAEDHHIFSDMSSDLAARHSLASSFYKKLAPNGNSPSADAAALKKFRAVNDRLKDLPKEFIAVSEAESCFYDYYRDNLRVALEPRWSKEFDLDFIRESIMCGPGSAQKADSTYMVSKLFESPISYINPALIGLYRNALANSGMWCEAEMQRNAIHGFVKVLGGSLFFATKNAGISRTCCTEASLELLIQKAVGAFFEVRLGTDFGIYLKTQPDLNRRMARIGSIDGSIGTIDLVSASDSIALNLVQRDLPDGFLKRTLLACRSTAAVLPDGELVELNMVSTMGNGFTFPLQTLIFACAVRAVYTLMGKTCVNPATEFGVFGDDLIVHRDVYEFLIKMLNKLGFEVNVNKSFNTGSFRESCGHDYVNGLNIRGVYIRSLETHQQVYSALNRLIRWSSYHGICLSATIGILRSWARDIRVPPSESDDAGIHVPFVLSKRPSLTADYWFKYRCYVRKVRRKAVLEPDASDSPKGIACGYLSGHIRRRDILLTSTEYTGDGFTFSQPTSAWSQKDQWAASVSLRDRLGARPRYKIVTKSIPYWDYLHSPHSAGSDREWDEWRVDLTVDRYEAWKDLVSSLMASSQ